MLSKSSVRLLLVCVFGVAMAAAQAADVFPSRAVRWVVPFAPGASNDVIARVMAQKLTEVWGQQVLIDNRAGGGNNIGTEMALKAPPDGYTLLLVNPANAINATLYRTLPFDFLRDYAPVAGIIRVPNVMEVTLSLPARTESSTMVSITKRATGS